jgi:predicted transcriptional regulator
VCARHYTSPMRKAMLLRLPPEVHDALRREAARQGKPMNVIAERAIRAACGEPERAPEPMERVTAWLTRNAGRGSRR